MSGTHAIVRCLILTLVFGFVPVAASAQTEFLPEQPVLVVELAPEEAHTTKGTYVQAQLRMSLRLRGRYAYEALAVTLPEIPDAEIITLQRPRTRYLVSYAGAGHVYEASYAIIPQRSGLLSIPPIRIAGRVRTDAGEDLNFDLTSEGFEVQVDPAVEGFAGGKWFVADLVEISDEWSHDPEDVRVGDVFRREIHIKARGTTGDRMPYLEMPRAAGATLVDAGRTTETEITGSDTIGHLWQSWDIRIDRDTFAEISPVRMFYWNTSTHAEDVVWLPVSRIEPLPADRAAIADEIMTEVRAEYEMQQIYWVELLMILAAPFVLLFGAWIFALVPSRADLRLRRALRRSPTAKQALSDIHDWATARAGKRAGAASLLTHPDIKPELRRMLANLNAAAFSLYRTEIDAKAIAELCLADSRRARLAHLRTVIGALFERVFGTEKPLGHT